MLYCYRRLNVLENSVIEHHKLLCYVTGQTGTAQTVSCYLMTSDPMSGWSAEMNVREKLLAYIRDNHPEWWPREIVVISHNDIARGEQSKRTGKADSAEVDGSETTSSETDSSKANSSEADNS